MPVWNPPNNQPPQGAYLLSNSLPYWQLNIWLDTPTGTVQGSFFLSPQPDGSGTMLYSTVGGSMRGNAERAQNTGVFAGSPKPGFNSPYFPTGEIFATPPLPNASGLVVAPCHIIGINVGIRKGGYLACNLSISYFGENAKPTTNFWQQDISYYRYWSLPLPVPPVLTGITDIAPYTYPPYAGCPPGWQYMVVGYTGVGSNVTATLAPFPLIYNPNAALQYGGGKPVWATQSSALLGQLYQMQYPDASDLMPQNGTYYQPGLQSYLDACVNPGGIYAFPNQYAFVGDVFPGNPYNYVSTSSFAQLAWFQQALGKSSWCACASQRSVQDSVDGVYGATGLNNINALYSGLSAYGAPYYVRSTTANGITSQLYPPGWTFLPGFNYGPLNSAYATGDTAIAPIYLANPGGPTAPPGITATMPALLPQLGVPVGANGECTLYYLNAIAPNGIPT